MSCEKNGPARQHHEPTRRAMAAAFHKGCRDKQSALATKYPDDDEAQIFYALYLGGTQTASDQTYSAYRKAAAILEKQFAKHPDHPGVAHYLIHSYDAPPLAAQGLPAARRYAAIAPDAPHALHMPSHIFTRVGAWADSATTNRRSADTAERSNDPDDALHALDYMTYAYLQLARDADARKTFTVESHRAGSVAAGVVRSVLPSMRCSTAITMGRPTR